MSHKEKREAFRNFAALIAGRHILHGGTSSSPHGKTAEPFEQSPQGGWVVECKITHHATAKLEVEQQRQIHAALKVLAGGGEDAQAPGGD